VGDGVPDGDRVPEGVAAGVDVSDAEPDWLGVFEEVPDCDADPEVLRDWLCVMDRVCACVIEGVREGVEEGDWLLERAQLVL